MTRESASLDITFRPNFEGDFNGDNRRDLLVASAPDTLSIYWGEPDRYVSDRAGASIPMSPPAGVAHTEPFVADFNKDGISDIVLRHHLTEPNKHVLEIKLSK